MHAYDGVSGRAPSEFLARLDGVEEDHISAQHAWDHFRVATVHVAVALAGYGLIGRHSQDRHTGSVFGDKASSVAGLRQHDDELGFDVEGGLHGGRCH